jgi:L-arabinose isomerase
LEKLEEKMNSTDSALKIGLFGIGLDTYWPQFTGLKERLISNQEKIVKGLNRDGVIVVNAGLVDNLEKSFKAADLFKRENVELIFLYISTYALSSTVLPVVQRSHAPVVVLNLQPTSKIDYQSFNNLSSREEKTGEWLAHCQAVSAPEIASVFNRTDINYHLITGTLDDPDAWSEINDWVDGAFAAKIIQGSRIGLLGHYYCGMLDVYSDYTQLSGAFKNHFELLEIDELNSIRNRVTDKDIEEMLREFKQVFDVSPECREDELQRAAKTSIALHQLIEKHRLNAMAYYYEGQPGNEHENIITSIIAGNTLLTAKHVPVAGEYEVKNVIAMKIMDILGAGGSFSEFYAMDFDDDIIMLGHDGPGHATIAEGKVKLVPLKVYHGKPGQGLSIQMSVKNGPVTLLSVCQDREGKIKLLVAEGESVPGPILDIGNTNSRYRFSIGVKAYINAWSEAGPSHHCAIGIGHVAGKLRHLAEILGIEFEQIC